jgi:hypothetical protein
VPGYSKSGAKCPFKASPIALPPADLYCDRIAHHRAKSWSVLT